MPHALPSACPLAPYEVVAERLAEIWARILELDQVGPRDDFFQLGGDSLAAASLLVQIRQEFGRELPLSILAEAPTVETLAERISRRARPPSSPLLLDLQPHGPRPPFFCVHGVGGTGLCFANLARRLTPEQPFYAIRADYLERQDDRFASIESLAARYLEEVRTFQPEGPYFLGGYSFGGSVALEMAQQLSAEGQPVALLAIFHHTPPPLRYQSVLRRPAFLLDFLRNLPYWVLDDLLRSDFRDVRSQVRIKLRAVGRRLRNRFARHGPDLAVQEVQDIFDVSRVPDDFRKLLELHYRALRAYQPKVYAGPVTLFRARTRPLFRLHGHDLGWLRLAGGGLEIITVPGNHNTILKEPHVGILAERLRDRLGKAQAMHPARVP